MAKRKPQRCSKCGLFGHRKNNCAQPIAVEAPQALGIQNLIRQIVAEHVTALRNTLLAEVESATEAMEDDMLTAMEID